MSLHLHPLKNYFQHPAMSYIHQGGVKDGVLTETLIYSNPIRFTLG